ncbi:hypothetical protein I8H89_03570 [Candidatus Saccharibacteria bacterium]|nr:hypothetical protein [Candidatus Saccharibacteria bacterium]
MNSKYEHSVSAHESARNKFKKGIGTTLAAAGILLAPACAADEVENIKPISISSQETALKQQMQDLEFETGREEAKQYADKLSSQLLDLMEDPRSHTQTLDTGVHGIANKKHVVQDINTPSPELRAIYRPEGGTLYISGTQSYEREDGSHKIDEVSIGYVLGGETRLSLQDKTLEDFDARSIRQMIRSGDTDLVSVASHNQEGNRSAVMFLDAFASEQITDGKFTEITPPEYYYQVETVTPDDSAKISADKSRATFDLATNTMSHLDF